MCVCVRAFVACALLFVDVVLSRLDCMALVPLLFPMFVRCVCRKSVMFITAGLLPGSVLVTLLCLNMVSLWYNTINSIPFTLIVSTFLVWMFVSLPMVIGGSILGRCVTSCHVIWCDLM